MLTMIFGSPALVSYNKQIPPHYMRKPVKITMAAKYLMRGYLQREVNHK